MNILWLSHFVPYPPKGGCFQRSYNLIRETSFHNDVYLVALKHKDDARPDFNSETAKNELGKFCKKVIIVDVSKQNSGFSLYFLALKSIFIKDPLTVNLFKSKEMGRIISELSRDINFHIVHYDTISLAYYVNDAKGGKKIINHHGIESYMIYRRIVNEPNILNKVYLHMEGFKLKRYEKRNCHKFDMNIVVSELDRTLLNEIDPSLRIEVIENGVDTHYFSPSENNNNNNNRLIFIGRLDQYSNRDGILYFCDHVWPLIRENIPNIFLTIIGNNPPSKLIELSKKDERLEVLGYVDDVRPCFSNAAIYICPIRDGGGTRIKILDAMAMGMPIVATTIACEGIEVTPGEDILIANTPKEFLEKIMELFSKEEFRDKIGRNARKKAESIYSWEIIGEKLDSIYNQ